MGFGLRLGPVRINKRGISVGGGVGVGPFGVGGGVRVAKFRGKSSYSSKDYGEGLGFLVSIIRSIDGLFVRLENKTKKYYKNFRVNKYLLFFVCLIFGVFGVHRFLTGKVRTGIYYYFTSGGFFIGYIRDLYLILSNKYTDVWNRKVEGNAFSFLTNIKLIKSFKKFSISKIKKSI